MMIQSHRLQRLAVLFVVCRVFRRVLPSSSLSIAFSVEFAVARHSLSRLDFAARKGEAKGKREAKGRAKGWWGSKAKGGVSNRLSTGLSALGLPSRPCRLVLPSAVVSWYCRSPSHLGLAVHPSAVASWPCCLPVRRRVLVLLFTVTSILGLPSTLFAFSSCLLVCFGASDFSVVLD